MKNEPNIFELEYSKRFPFIKISSSNLFAIFFIAIFTGFLAFVMETIVDIFVNYMLVDQGIFTGPFIPMYACLVFLGLLFIKTPKRSIKSGLITFLVFFFGISIVELAVGYILEWTVHQVVWSYDGMLPLSFKYVSIVASLFWGVLGTLYYFYLIPLFKKIPDKIVKTNLDRLMITIIVVITIILDMIFSYHRIRVDGGWNELYVVKFSFNLWLFVIGIILYIVAVVLCGIFTIKRIKPLVKEKGKWPFIILYMILVILPVVSCVNYLHRNKSLELLAQLGFLSAGFLIYYAIAGIILLLIRIIVKAISKKEFFKTNIIKAANTLLAMLVSIIICLIGVASLKNPKVVNISCGSGDNSLNIVAISDLHYESIGSAIKLDDFVNNINSLNPDLVLLVGDNIDNYVSDIDRDSFVNAMKSINSKYGIYGVAGNHEYETNGYSEIIDFYKDSGINLLINEEVVIDNKVRIIGRIDYVYRSYRKSIESISKNKDLPLIVLDHQPQDYMDSYNAGATLQLSGHTHNGQLWPANLIVNLYYRVAFKSSYTNGLYQKDNYTCYITKGYGNWGFPMRTSGRAEIVKIDFKY